MTTPIDDLLAQAQRISETPEGPRREALALRYYRLAAPIVDERADLLKKLNAGYDRLNATSPDADPKYADKERIWLEQWLPRYQELVDALTRAETRIRAFPHQPIDSTPLLFPMPPRSP